MKNKKVLVVLGGTSGEREVSLDSGRACVKALKKLGFSVSTFDPKIKPLNLIDRNKTDIIFNALHGKDGEDGIAQSYFEYLRIPYTHSGVISSYNAMNFKLWSAKEPFSVNKFGILEPNKKNLTVVPDIVLVPLAAFDSKLNRIGYGKGYYDRKLKEINKIKKNVISIGIAYSFQKCRTIPVDKNDFKLDYILTEHGIIKSKK